MVLQRNLTDALDIQRSKTLAVFVNVLNKKQADVTPMVGMGIVITGYGTAIYYCLPLALLSLNLTLLSKIVIFILVSLLFSLTLLFFNLQGIIQRFSTHIFLCFEKRSTKAMVIKNLSAHRQRN